MKKDKSDPAVSYKRLIAFLKGVVADLERETLDGRAIPRPARLTGKP
jgi:hypothetical protein